MATRAACSKNGVEFSALGFEHSHELVVAGSSFHNWIVDLDRVAHGKLSRASGIARRFGRQFERRRARDCRQSAPTTFSQNPRRRTGRALGDAARRRSFAYHEFHSLESAKPWIPSAKTLDWRNHVPRGAIS